jgi:hypothetical protein
MGHNPPKPPPGFVPKNVADAHWLGQPVVLWCLNCAAGRKVSSWTIFQKRGALAFGTVHGSFWCHDCKRSAVVIVLPVFCPTPRAWAVHAPRDAPSDEAQRQMLLNAENLPFRIDRWNKDGTIAQLIAKVADLEAGREVFEIARRKYHDCWQLTLREGLVVYDVHGKIKLSGDF